MAKKRKTRQQKKLADSRHEFRHQLISRAFDIQPQLVQSQNNNKSTSAYYPYLIKDLSRTAILSLGIIASQILLFLILKNNLIKIPGISY